MDGQCKCGLEGNGTVMGGNAKPGYEEATSLTHRPFIHVGKGAIEKKKTTNEITCIELRANE